MVQESIVEYINAQMKLGVSRDVIKTTLTGAGWVAADVEDTLKKVESAKIAQPISAMAAMAAVSAMSPASSSPAAKPMEPAIAAKPFTPAIGMGAGSTSPAPQTIRVSDLVSSSTSSSPVMKPSTMPASKSPLTGPAPASVAMPAGKKTKDTFQAASYPGAKPHGSRGMLVTDIVLIVIIIAVGGIAGFLYMQNKSLSSQLGSLNGQSSGVTSQLSALQAEVAASTTALTAQVSSLTTQTQELQMELSFFATPASAMPGATSTATVSGIVSAGKTGYVITAMYGAKIVVANSKAASVIAALAPLMATATSTAPAIAASPSSTATSTPVVPTVIPATPATAGQFTGTYMPGSDTITLTAVNGTAL
jgi:hypothetical protein